MSKAKVGDKVKVHYTGKLTDGVIFDSSENREPLEFTIGENQVLKKFEDTVVGLEIGDSKSVFIEAIDAYGEKQDQLVIKIPKKDLPETIKPEIDMKLQMQTPDGGVVVVKIIEIGEEEITIDGNHDLADEDLNFDIKLVEISE